MSGYVIPHVVNRTPRGDRVTDVYSRLLEERIVYLGTELDDGVANAVIAQVLHLEAENPDLPVNLYVNSTGGSPAAVLAVYDTLRFVRTPVATTCVGQAFSATALLLAAGDPGQRAVLPHARVLLHQPAGQGAGPSRTSSSRRTRSSPCGRSWRRRCRCTRGRTSRPCGATPTATGSCGRTRRSPTGWPTR